MWFFMLASAGIDKLPKNVVFYVGQRWHRQITKKRAFLCCPALASTNYPKMWFFMLASAGIDKLPKKVVIYVTNCPKMWFFMLASAGIDKLPKNVVFLCWPAL